MPVYEYRCGSCEETVEEIQPMGSEAPGPCPSCGGELRRRWGRVAVRFAGWGFSKTDSLLPEKRRRQDFGKVAERAEQIAEGD